MPDSAGSGVENSLIRFADLFAAWLRAGAWAYLVVGLLLVALGVATMVTDRVAPAVALVVVGALLVVGPLAVGATHATASGAILVGDAAFFLDPFTGEGMYTALANARDLSTIEK